MIPRKLLSSVAGKLGNLKFDISDLRLRISDQGGVGKPGGFTNTLCLTGPGGLLKNPGGFSTESRKRLD